MRPMRGELPTGPWPGKAEGSDGTGGLEGQWIEVEAVETTTKRAEVLVGRRGVRGKASGEEAAPGAMAGTKVEECEAAVIGRSASFVRMAAVSCSPLEIR